jgi:hypothetical protein
MTTPITAEHRERMLTVLTNLRTDIQTDVLRMEGAPFDGHTVATWFGNLAAQVDALAHILQVILKAGEQS